MQLKENNIENILALRGDIPENPDFVLPDRFHHASDLIREIKKYKEKSYETHQNNRFITCFGNDTCSIRILQRLRRR